MVQADLVAQLSRGHEHETDTPLSWLWLMLREDMVKHWQYISVSLTTSCLSICHEIDIIPLDELFDEVFHTFVIHSLLIVLSACHERRERINFGLHFIIHFSKDDLMILTVNFLDPNM